jgi:ribosomal protein S18 acetylase RimI-like enzyme
MFATASLAARIERAESSTIAELAGASAARLGSDRVFVARVGGGVAVHAGPGSPLNKLAGLGFAPAPSVEQLEAVESEFARRDAPLQVELASLGDPGIARLLTGRGYRLVGFENVLGLRLDATPAEAGPGPIHVARAEPEDDAAWMEAVATGFLSPDTYDGPPAHESFPREAMEEILRDTLAAPSFERFVARRNGIVAGGASLRLHEGVAQLAGAATRPEHRRLGVQTALLRHRLHAAARRGCDVAVVTTAPGSKSAENVQRFGFSILYVRAVLVKPH